MFLCPGKALSQEPIIGYLGIGYWLFESFLVFHGPRVEREGVLAFK
jgi:hypothetical protein